MGVDRAYVSGLELGQHNLTILTLWHIAKALGVKLRPFVDEENLGLTAATAATRADCLRACCVQGTHHSQSQIGYGKIIGCMPWRPLSKNAAVTEDIILRLQL